MAYNETGTVIHGYVSGATVFHDTNLDGVLNNGEVGAITDVLGQYFLQSAPGPLVSIGGTDTSTNLPITLPLQAPEGSTVITPLTTLVSLLLPTNPTASDIAAATNTVTASLGISLSAGQSLLTLDTVAGTLNGNPGATDAYLTAAKVYDTISILSAGLSNQGSVSVEAARSGVTAALADKLNAAAASGQPLDLGNPAALREVLTSAAATAGTTVNTSAVTSIANIAVASNVAMDNVVAGATSGQAIFQASSTVQHVAEGATTSALQNLPANQPVSSVEAQYSNPVAVGAGTGDNTLVVRVSGDHYQGDPQFQVYVDGKAVGNPQSVTAVHTQGQWQDITLKGDFSPASAHNVEVRFLNDAYDGSFNFSEGHDKNLYVSSITLDGNKFGATDANPAVQLSNGGINFTTAPVQTPTTGGTGGTGGSTGGSTGGTGGSTGGTGGSTGGTGNTGTGDNTLVVRVSGDHYQGDPQFQVYVDGKAVGDPQSVTAVHTQGQWQDITLKGDFSPASAHNVEVRFLNDAYDGSLNFSEGHDKNLYVSSITLDGNKFGATDANPAELMSNGGFSIDTTATTVNSGSVARFSALSVTSASDSTGQSTLAGGQSQPIIGSAGDTLSGGLSAGAHDTLTAGSGANLSAGHSTLVGGQSQLTIGSAGDTLYGGLTSGAHDTLTASSGNNLLSVKYGDNVLHAGSGLDTLQGGSGHDTLYGGGSTAMFAGSGGDTLYGGLSAGAHDTLNSGAGNDLLSVTQGNNVLIGGAGLDTLQGGSGHDTLYGGGTSAMFAGSGGDTLYGGLGSAAHDTLMGGAGNDLLSVTQGNNALYASGGMDTLHAGSGNDTLYAGSGDAKLYGGSGHTTFEITGTTGNDTIVGGSGSSSVIIDGHSSTDAHYKANGDGSTTITFAGSSQSLTTSNIDLLHFAGNNADHKLG